MKKFIAIIAAIAMIATMSVSVFAENGTLNDVAEPDVMSASQAVSATYADTAASKADEIHLDIVWDDVAFTYTNNAKIWNEDTMKWEDTTGSWTDGAAKVKVSSRSSVPVTVEAEYVADGVAASFDQESINLAAANAAKVDGEFTLTVDPAAKITATDATAGTITITVGPERI